MNLMLINVSTRRFGRAVRLPEGDIPAPAGAGVSKSAVSRRLVALSAAQMNEWMAADLSKRDLLVIQIDGILRRPAQTEQQTTTKWPNNLSGSS